MRLWKLGDTKRTLCSLKILQISGFAEVALECRCLVPWIYKVIGPQCYKKLIL
jgi:hypothetical protein